MKRKFLYLLYKYIICRKIHINLEGYNFDEWKYEMKPSDKNVYMRRRQDE